MQIQSILGCHITVYTSRDAFEVVFIFGQNFIRFTFDFTRPSPLQPEPGWIIVSSTSRYRSASCLFFLSCQMANRDFWKVPPQWVLKASKIEVANRRVAFDATAAGQSSSFTTSFIRDQRIFLYHVHTALPPSSSPVKAKLSASQSRMGFSRSFCCKQCASMIAPKTCVGPHFEFLADL